MFKPKYTLNNKILSNLSNIERIYGQLESRAIPNKLLLNLEKHNLIKSSFTSNSIEGNPLSEVEVTNLLLNGRIPVNRDEKEVRNYFDILQSLENEYSSLNTQNILDIHRKLLTGVEDEIAGKFRNKKVVVGNPSSDGSVVVKHEPPEHRAEKIQKSLEDLVSWTNTSDEIPILKAGIYHHQFVYIHPFVDGNGRTCRLTTSLLLLLNEYKINKYFVIDDYYDIDRIQYSNALHSADSGDKTKWLEYFTDGVKYSLESALSKTEQGIKELSMDTRPSPRETDVLDMFKQYTELTSSLVSDKLDISRQQAFNLLDGLVEKGFVRKSGITKNSYYILK